MLQFVFIIIFIYIFVHLLKKLSNGSPMYIICVDSAIKVVTFIYIALYIIQIAIEKLYSNKQKNVLMLQNS